MGRIKEEMSDLMEQVLKNFPVNSFTDTLLLWFYENKRDLPWRNNPTPYHVWISEVMLQQTQVKTVIPYFNNFIRKFPTIKALALADEQDVLKAWEGLGYYSRARNLHHAAKTILERFNGEFPTTYDDVIALKGIGTYTAGAIMSMAFGEKAAAVDGNVMRVMSRILYITDDIGLSKTKKYFERIMMDVVPEKDPGAFNQSLMDLGATICTPRSPKCGECPVQAFCRGFKADVQEQLPVKAKKIKPKRVPLIILIIQDDKGRYLMNQRPSTGLLGGMWEFVQFEGMTVEEFQKQTHLFNEKDWRVERYLGEVTHVFSHLIWEMRVYHMKCSFKSLPEEMAWFTEEQLDEIPISTAHKKVRQLLKG